MGGEGETVIGMVQMLAGKTPKRSSLVSRARVQDIQATSSRVTIEPYYDRTIFVSKVMQTAQQPDRRWLCSSSPYCFLFLGDRARVFLIVAFAIPLAMLIAFIGMMQAGLGEIS